MFGILMGRHRSTSPNAMSQLIFWVGHVTTLLVLAVLSYRLGTNLRFLKQTKRRAAQITPHTAVTQNAVTPEGAAPSPRVSVLVPARNESATITACITSLLHQDFADYEIIVLNDASTDGTAAQLDALAQRDVRLRVIHAQETLPAGWNGKSYACYRLAMHATGEWLLFTDADTQHTPQSIAHGIAQANVLGVDFLSAFPHQVTQSWSERILVSFIVDFLPLVWLDLRAISQGRGNDSGGNGQYLLMRKSIYHAIGGHAAIAQATLDDFALARRYRQAGHKVALVDGRAMVQCRMYRSAHEVWEGFSRSLMHGLDNSTLARHGWRWALLFVWGFGCLFVNPYIYVWRDHQRALAIGEIAWLLTLRAVANRHLRRAWIETLTTPLAAWGVMALGLAAWRRRWQGQKVAWKGRYYMG